ncbi:MAG: N-acetyltransferase family protein [Mycobacterium leprae]
MEMRRLVPADIAAYKAIRLEALELAPEAFGSDLAEQRTMSDAEWLVRIGGSDDAYIVGAFEGGQLIGTAGFSRERRRKTRHKGGIWGVYVTPAARGQGVARRLMAAILEDARHQEGLEQLTLAVVSENAAALALYRQLGFTVYGTERHALKLNERYLDEELMLLFL